MPGVVRRALGLLLLVLALAACGSGGGLTRAQYDAKLSRLCLRSADQFRELHLDLSVGVWRHSASDILRIDRNFAAKLAALRPPASIASAAATHAKATANVAQDDRNAVAAAKAADATKLRAAIAQENKDNEATFPSAKAIGATGCYVPS